MSRSTTGYHLLGRDGERLFTLTTRAPAPSGLREAFLSDRSGNHSHLLWNDGAPGIVPSASRLKTAQQVHVTPHRQLSTETNVVARLRIGVDPNNGQQFGQILDPHSTVSTPPAWATTATFRRPVQMPGTSRDDGLVDVVIIPRVAVQQETEGVNYVMIDPTTKANAVIVIRQNDEGLDRTPPPCKVQ
jgi:hypothetical protein